VEVELADGSMYQALQEVLVVVLVLELDLLDLAHLDKVIMAVLLQVHHSMALVVVEVLVL
jgi:hypothetical protein